MPATTVELRPDRKLLEHDFEGYKLNLQSLPHWAHQLAKNVDKVHPDDVQYSFLHAKLFALHNHLISDNWDHRYMFYYIDRNQKISRIIFNSTTQSFESNVVYDVPLHEERKPGHFNLCLSFPSNDIAVVSDGMGYLHIVSTPSRVCTVQTSDWNTVFSSLILGENNYFVIVDTRSEEKNEKQLLHCLLQSVEQNENFFSSVITWVTFESEGVNWKQVCMKQLQGKGVVHYAAIESSFQAVYIASDNQFKFTMDSEKEITEPEKVKVDKKILYTWLQTTEDITITLKLPENYNRTLFHVDVTPLAIKLSYAGSIFVNGKLKHKVDSELTTWNIEDGRVDVLLTKSESMLWDELVQGADPNGEQILDASLVEEAHKRLMHLCSETEVVSNDQSVPGFSTQELEECDAASEEDTILGRYEASSHSMTHRIPLSVHQYLFHMSLEPREVPSLVLRHDVDACIWQPYPKMINSDAWPMRHQGTLSAFGYVQSSKQNRKFLACPPNFSYAVVCEASRHIFIYCRNSNSDCQLRQRTPTGMKKILIGQQRLFNIDKLGEVLGIHATNNYLFLLTESNFVAIEIM